MAARSDRRDPRHRFEHVAVAGEDQGGVLVRNDHQRFEVAQIYVGAPILGEFDRGAHQMALMAFELGLQPFEKREGVGGGAGEPRSEEHTSELQSLMRISYAVFCLKKKKQNKQDQYEIWQPQYI